MLTMQIDQKKSEIIKEAYRILKPGALYGIHEMGLEPDSLSEEKKAEIQRDLAETIKINASPLTVSEWSHLIEKEGFEIVKIETNPMHLLRLKRMIDDEGILRTIKILFNLSIHPKARARILNIKKVFLKHQSYLNAVSIVAKKK